MDDLARSTMPFCAALGITTQQATAERVTLTLDWAAERCTIGGAMHGGAIMTLADSAGAICAFLNLPEGAALSIPLRREGMSRWKSFFWGQFSGMVEPLGGLLGAALVMVARPVLPYALAFAAGAMIFVVAEEVIPESQKGEHSHLATLGVMLGFALMMFLDVALG